jgi:membrane protein implicated in regulation of membrane protease activity
MRKATMHYILDAIEGIILLLLVASGFILWFALPEGSAADKTVLFNRSTWVQAHQWLAVGLLAFFSTHIITHWTWISYMTRNYFKRMKKD